MEQIQLKLQGQFNQLANQVIQGAIGAILSDLESAQFVLLKQQIDNTECLQKFGAILMGACEGDNIYDLYLSTEDGQPAKETPIGSVYEKSECLNRFWLCQLRESQFTFSSGRSLNVNKECHCLPFLCYPCIKPIKMQVKDQDQLVGKIEQTSMFCGRSSCEAIPYVELDIFDRQGNKSYYISGSACQEGNLARKLLLGLTRPCACQNIFYDIKNQNNETVGRITNKYYGCVTECCTKSDQFVIQFPTDADFYARAQIIMATIGIDFYDFESACYNFA